jgi:peptidoglycan/LPS O-acetylase OafA/YrhL
VAISAVPASFLLPLLSENATVLDAALGDLLAALGCLALIDGATSGRLGALGPVLARRVPAYLGRISYGIYLYHPLVKWLVFDGLAVWEDEPPEGGLAFLMLTSLSVGVAIVSWHAVEAPLVRLKRRLPYARPPAPALRAADERRAVPQAA